MRTVMFVYCRRHSAIGSSAWSIVAFPVRSLSMRTPARSWTVNLGVERFFALVGGRVSGLPTKFYISVKGG
jgi:hypothetical protein